MPALARRCSNRTPDSPPRITVPLTVALAVCGIFAVAGLAPVAAGAVSRPSQEEEITTVQVTDGIYMLVGPGGNVGVSVGDDGAFVIDDKFAPLTEKILAAIAAVTDQPVKFVVNTHWHGDHTGGNENLGKAGAMIVAHENVRARMNPEEFRDIVGNSNQAPPDALPVVTFTDAVNFYWNGDKIHVFHTEPGHTDGDSIVMFTEANVVHMGDNYFAGLYPFIDVDSGGSINGMIAAAATVLAHTDEATKIIPGHGDLSDSAGLSAYHDMLVTARERVQSMIDDGKSEDEVVAADPFAELHSDWGWPEGGFIDNERFMRLVYRGLTRD